MTSLQIERRDGIPVARPTGDIDSANADRVRDDLAECVEQGADVLILDLSTTRYLDSAGLDMLFRFAQRLRERRARLLVVIPAVSQLSRLAGLVGLGGAMPLHETVQDALADRSPHRVTGAYAEPEPDAGEGEHPDEESASG